MSRNSDFNGGAIECPHCKRLATLRKNETGLFYLEKIKEQQPKFKVDDRVEVISFHKEGRVWGVYKGFYEGERLYDIALDGSRNLTFAQESNLRKVDKK